MANKFSRRKAAARPGAKQVLGEAQRAREAQRAGCVSTGGPARTPDAAAFTMPEVVWMPVLELPEAFVVHDLAAS